MSAKGLRTVSVIVTRLASRGDGKDDPFRIITQIWDMTDRLIFEWDPLATIENITEGPGFDDFVAGVFP